MSTTMTRNVGLGAEDLILVAVDGHDGSAYQRSLPAGIDLARGTDRSLLLYDRSAESSLVDPYPYPDGIDDTCMLDAQLARCLGRDYLAEQIEVCQREGISASGWLPRAAGPKEMARCVRTFGVNAAILPAELDSPSLVDRVRGNCLHRFHEELDVPVLIVTAESKLQVMSDGAAAETRAPLAMNYRPSPTPHRRSA
jgi:hypothetical protein